MNVANAFLAQAREEAKKRLREFLEASDTGRQAIEMTADGNAYEMKGLDATGRAARIEEVEDEDVI